MGKTSEVGYRKPPADTRFRKGRSGNPKGRPRGRHSRPPYDAVLGQMVTVKEGGVERWVTAAEAFLLYMTKRGLEGDSVAARITIAAIEEMCAMRIPQKYVNVRAIVMVGAAPGSVTSALRPLHMAKKLDRFRPSARMLLEPWLVEAALARLGKRRLSREEQAKVVEATGTPHKVRWPAWWEVKR